MYSPNCNLNWFRDQQVQDFKIIVIWFESILKRQIAFQRIKKSKIKPCILKDIRQKDYSLSSWRFKNTEKLTFDDHRTKSILKNVIFLGKKIIFDLELWRNCIGRDYVAIMWPI